MAVEKALGGCESVRIDPNPAWDDMTARRAIAGLDAAGVDLIEQPVSCHDRATVRRLSWRLAGLFMTDEVVANPKDAFALARDRDCDVYVLKIAKSGGPSATAKVAAAAETAGQPVARSAAAECPNSEEWARARDLQRIGKHGHLWRVAGRDGNVSILDVDGPD